MWKIENKSNVSATKGGVVRYSVAYSQPHLMGVTRYVSVCVCVCERVCVCAVKQNNAYQCGRQGNSDSTRRGNMRNDSLRNWQCDLSEMRMKCDEMR